MEQFFTVLNQIIIFLILILLGILAVKTSILDEKSLGNLSKLVMRMALPAFIFINTAEGATKAGLVSSLMVIPLAIGLYLILFLLSQLLIRLFGIQGNRARVFQAIAMFGNVGFLGIPLLVELYPETALLYVSLFTILDQSLFWTYGVSLTKPAAQNQSGLSFRGLRNLLSPALIAIVLATVFVLLDIHLPAVLVSACEKLGAASMPLSLLYIGGMLSLTDVRSVLKCGELYAEIVLKMLLLPIVLYAGIRLLGLSTDMAGTITFLSGLPAINMVAMLAKANGSDGDYAVCAVMMTTIASLVTLPLVSLGITLI